MIPVPLTKTAAGRVRLTEELLAPRTRAAGSQLHIAREKNVTVPVGRLGDTTLVGPHSGGNTTLSLKSTRPGVAVNGSRWPGKRFHAENSFEEIPPSQGPSPCHIPARRRSPSRHRRIAGCLGRKGDRYPLCDVMKTAGGARLVPARYMRGLMLPSRGCAQRPVRNQIVIQQ